VHPRGGMPLATSATVIGGPLWLADAMATAACLGGAEALASICLRTGLTGFVTTPDQRLISAPGTPLVWPRAS
jgi:thiamine biosynthesis lipoprotein ApbE